MRDVIVIGGGCTGTGIARDLSMRGLSVTLIERGDLAWEQPAAAMECSTAERGTSSLTLSLRRNVPEKTPF